jgi:hypothetical protein
MTSSASYADKTSCSHELRVSSRFHIAAIVPALGFLIIGALIPAGIALDLKRTADLLKSAHLLKLEKANSKDMKCFKEFYGWLISVEKGVSLGEAEVLDYLADIYVNGRENGFCATLHDGGSRMGTNGLRRLFKTPEAVYGRYRNQKSKYKAAAEERAKKNQCSVACPQATVDSGLSLSDGL